MVALVIAFIVVVNQIIIRVGKGALAYYSVDFDRLAPRVYECAFLFWLFKKVKLVLLSEFRVASVAA